MSEQQVREAWIRIPTEEEMPARTSSNRNTFEFRPAMGRLLETHDRIGPAFLALYNQIMSEPGHLSRQEREMVAAVAASAQDCYY